MSDTALSFRAATYALVTTTRCGIGRNNATRSDRDGHDECMVECIQTVQLSVCYCLFFVLPSDSSETSETGGDMTDKTASWNEVANAARRPFSGYRSCASAKMR